MSELKQRRLAKERGMSPIEVLSIFENQDDVESAIVIIQKEDGYIECEMSVDSSLEAIGMLEVVKSNLILDESGIFDEE